jgi:hypothetical protein
VKRILLVLGALMMTVSGVAAVSAYEAHVVNVTAHIENALDVDPDFIDFGTVFPEEWFTREVYIGTSNSFCEPDQLRAKSIKFKVYAAWKEYPVGHPLAPGYYPWLGDALYLGWFPDDGSGNTPPPPNPVVSDNLTNVGPAPQGPPGVKQVLNNAEIQIKKFPLPPGYGYLVIGLDVPVFEGYWNEHTDVETKPSGLSGPSYEIPKKLGDGSDNPAWNPDGVDLGVDIIIQVTDILE